MSRSCTSIFPFYVFADNNLPFRPYVHLQMMLQCGNTVTSHMHKKWRAAAVASSNSIRQIQSSTDRFAYQRSKVTYRSQTLEGLGSTNQGRRREPQIPILACCRLFNMTSMIDSPLRQISLTWRVGLRQVFRERVSRILSGTIRRRSSPCPVAFIKVECPIVNRSNSVLYLCRVMNVCS